jgi:hypothetical protein
MKSGCRDEILQPLVFDRFREELSVSATMATATAVKSTTTAVESATATTMEAASTHVTAVAAAISVTRSSIAITGTSVPIAVAAAIAVITAVSISVPAIPGSGADKQTAGEPRRSIVPVGRAGIRIVAVIAIGADGSRVAVTVSPIHRATDPNSDRDLSMGVSRSGNQQDTEYSEIA